MSLKMDNVYMLQNSGKDNFSVHDLIWYYTRKLQLNETKNKVSSIVVQPLRFHPDLVTNVRSACVPEWKPHLTGLLKVYVAMLLVPISCMTSLLNELANNVIIKSFLDLILGFVCYFAIGCRYCYIRVTLRFVHCLFW